MRTGAKLQRVCSLVREQNSPNTTSLHQQGERGRLCERLLDGRGGAGAFEFRHGHKWNSLTDGVNRLDEHTETQSTEEIKYVSSAVYKVIVLGCRDAEALPVGKLERDEKCLSKMIY